MKNSIISTNQILLPVKTHESVSAEMDLEQKFLDFLKTKSKIIVLSSHLDDAVLSMGSLITHLASLQQNISVVTVFTKGSYLQSDLTKKLIEQGACTNASKYFQIRQNEDKNALSLLGVTQSEYLGFTDAAWRTKDDVSSLYPNGIVGVEREKRDNALLSDIKKRLQTLPVDRDSIVFVPMGWGRRHVDHILVRDAGAEIFPRAIFYTDFPYVKEYRSTEDEFVAKRTLTPIVWRGESYEKKAEAILTYESQNTSLFMYPPMQLEYETFYVPIETKSL